MLYSLHSLIGLNTDLSPSFWISLVSISCEGKLFIKLQIKFKLHFGPVLRVLMAHYSLNRALVIAFARKKLETSPVFAFLGKRNLFG